VNRRSTVRRLVLVLAASLLMTVRLGAADDNLLLNGELVQGTLNTPDHWRTDSLRHNSKAFSWIHPPDMSGELRINGSASDFERWSQKLRLAPGWYRLSGELRAEAIQSGQGSVSIGVSFGETTLTLPIEVGSSMSWIDGSLYFKVGTPIEIQVVCMLAGSSGEAYFRHLRLVATTAPPPNANQADLEAIRARLTSRSRHSRSKPFARPRGKPWTVLAAIAALIAATISGWLGFKSDQFD